MGEPRFGPVEDARERRDDAQDDEKALEGLAILDREHGERAYHADTDEGHHPCNAQHERSDELCSIAADHPEEDSDQRKPPQSFRPYNGVGGLQVRDRRLDLFDHQRIVLSTRNVPVVEIDSLGAIEDLRRHQPVIGAAPRHQLHMRPALGDPPVLQRHDAVRGNDA